MIRSADGWLVGQRPADGRWGGLWELPRVELSPDAEPAAGLRDGLAASLGVGVEVGSRLGRIRHAVSGERIELQAWSATVDDAPQAVGYQTLRWVAEFGGLAMASAQRKLLAAVAPGIAPP
jgi:adenine-specific DNA glycosylase